MRRKLAGAVFLSPFLWRTEKQIPNDETVRVTNCEQLSRYSVSPW